MPIIDFEKLEIDVKIATEERKLKDFLLSLFTFFGGMLFLSFLTAANFAFMEERNCSSFMFVLSAIITIQILIIMILNVNAHKIVKKSVLKKCAKQIVKQMESKEKEVK